MLSPLARVFSSESEFQEMKVSGSTTCEDKGREGGDNEEEWAKLSFIKPGH
jgi:hypothetical protein